MSDTEKSYDCLHREAWGGFTDCTRVLSTALMMKLQRGDFFDVIAALVSFHHHYNVLAPWTTTDCRPQTACINTEGQQPIGV